MEELLERGLTLHPAATAPGSSIWTPLPGPQTDALRCQADELFYGGQAGGGKTDLLIGLALTAHRKSIVFRREYPQLKDIVSRSRDILGPIGRYNQTDHIWRDLPGQRSIEFGACQYEDDKQKYKGRPHDLKAFDELPDFTESQYLFLGGWNRTTIPGQRVRVVGTGNPPSTTSGEWVIRRWGPWLDRKHPKPAKAGELRWYVRIDGHDTAVDGPAILEHKGERLIPRSRTFIPAGLKDNPYLQTTNYETVLQGLPEPLRSQLLYGDFTIGLGLDPWQVIPTAWIEAAMARWTPEKPNVPMSALGVDVARGGRDRTSLSPRYGTWFGELRCFPGTSTRDGMSVMTLVAQVVEGPDTPIAIDIIGVGTSPYDAGVQLGFNVLAMNGAEGTEARDKTGAMTFANKRAEWWWMLREALDPDTGQNLAIPDDSELLADLTAPHWKMTVRGIQVESKDDIIERLGRSPDKGDSLVYAHSGHAMPGIIAYYEGLLEKQRN